MQMMLVIVGLLGVTEVGAPNTYLDAVVAPLPYHMFQVGASYEDVVAILGPPQHSDYTCTTQWSNDTGFRSASRCEGCYWLVENGAITMDFLNNKMTAKSFRTNTKGLSQVWLIRGILAAVR
jgi:hypothetical protein